MKFWNGSKVKQFVLNNVLLRELYFFLTRKKLYKGNIDKLIVKKEISKVKRVDKVIVSLTSYGNRIKELKYTLFSLVNQTLLPEKIIVYLAYNDKNLVSDELINFFNEIIEFHYCEDLKSYKKLIPAKHEFPEYVIVTADDDIYYPKYWLSELLKAHSYNDKAIICHQCIKITTNGKYAINKFNKWVYNPNESGISKFYTLLGGTGCLYPPNSLFEDYDNYSLIKKLVPYADDLWFYFMAILNNTKILKLNKLRHLKYVNIYREYGLIKESSTLSVINVDNNKNDEQFNSLLNYYKITENEFIKKLKS